MANEMGSENLDAKTNEPEENCYRLTIYPSRELPQQYKNAVIAPLLNSLRYGNDFFKLIDKDSYYKAYSIYIENLMAKPSCNIQLARLKDDTILGWSMWEISKLHYVWVKKEVRRQGIGRALLPLFDTISHVTNKGMHIWANHYPEVKFDPF